MSQLKTYKLSNNLWLHEYIPEQIYLEYANRKPHYLMNCLDPRLVQVDQFMRDRFGPVIINNWMTGGNRNWSGLRIPNSPYYKKFSQHSWGRASDKIFLNADAGEVRADIIANYNELYLPMGLTCIEAAVSWVHSDVRALLVPGELLIVHPV